MKRVLFICTRNSARSQMAEGLINHDLAGKVQAFPAGTETSSVRPLAIAVMKEGGIDISRHRSKSIDEFTDEKFDFVITLGDHTAESCPIFFEGVQRIHMGFPNPAAVSGGEEDKLTAFRNVGDQIRTRLVKFLSAQRP